MPDRLIYILPGLAVALLAFSLACSDRDRTNPLDPGYIDPGRSNLGFNALAGNNKVLLEWNPLEFDDLAGVRVQRITAGSNDTVALTDTSLNAAATRFVDLTPRNGITYSYHLKFDIQDSDEQPVTLPDTVTPGPVFTYVELIDFGEVVLFTPDFRDEVFSLERGFFDVVDIEVGNTLWVLDIGGIVHRFNRDGELLGSGVLTNASAIALDPLNSTVWVALAGRAGLIRNFRSNGDLISSRATGIPVTSLAVDVAGNGLWAGSPAPSIAKVDIGGTTSTRFSHSDFVRPELVVTSRFQSGVWIGDYGANHVMYYTTAGGMVWLRGGFVEVNDLVVNDEGSLCWVADSRADKVVMLDGRNGQVLNSMSGFGNPFYLAYNRENKTVIVSGNTGLLSVIDESGQLVFAVRNPDRTGKMALAY